MSRITLGEDVSIAAGTKATFQVHTNRRNLLSVRVNGDGNSTNLTIRFTGAVIDTGNSIAIEHVWTQAQNIDATSDYIVRYPDGHGYEEIRVEVVNNSSVATTVDVYGGEW